LHLETEVPFDFAVRKSVSRRGREIKDPKKTPAGKGSVVDVKERRCRPPFLALPRLQTLLLRYLDAHGIHEHLHVFPGGALGGRVAQQIGGMVGT